MREPPAVSLVCFDLASLVIDGSIVERAFAEAIATQGIVVGNAGLRSLHGQVRPGPGPSPGRRAARDLRRRRAAGAGRVAGLRPLFPRGRATVRHDSAAGRRRGAHRKAAASGAKVCLLSGLSGAACGDLLDELCRPGIADLALCADDAPRGFPWPDLVLTAMLRLGTPDVREVAMVSATENGLLSGWRAGARIVVAIDSGGRGPQAGATHVLENVAALPDLIISGG